MGKVTSRWSGMVGGSASSSATQKGMPFKIYDVFIPRIFHVMSLNHRWLQTTETTACENARGGGTRCDHPLSSLLLLCPDAMRPDRESVYMTP